MWHSQATGHQFTTEHQRNKRPSDPDNMNAIKTILLLCSAVSLCNCAAIPESDHARLRRQIAANPSFGTTLGNGIGQLTSTGLGALLGSTGTTLGGALQQPLSMALGSLFNGAAVGRDTPMVFQDQLGATYVLGRLNDALHSPYFYRY